MKLALPLCFLEKKKIPIAHDLPDPLVHCWLQGLLPFIHIFNNFLFVKNTTVSFPYICRA